MDTVFPTSTPAMFGEMQNKIDRLSENLDTANVLLRKADSNVDRFHERLMELVESGDIEDYVAEELADIFGRSLIRTVTVRVTAEIDIEINVPVTYDLDDLDGDLEVEITSAYSADVEIINSETSSVSVEV